ncbi:hypothetical protein RvY_15886 [Ramazzottius varieornatus]|uniref:Uncharacterized protein n=1 Tax=Ramazzottius varieornatus TaxID=947166 RepID=A0A1D1VXL3_RAMVA|nr:hypothetical protein RvY_15886 [Ramazzottius varieornatus]
MGVTADKMCGATPWSKASQLPSTPEPEPYHDEGKQSNAGGVHDLFRDLGSGDTANERVGRGISCEERWQVRTRNVRQVVLLV